MEHRDRESEGFVLFQVAIWLAYGGLLTWFAANAFRDGQPGGVIFVAAVVPVVAHALLQIPALRRRRRRARQFAGAVLAAWVGVTGFRASTRQSRGSS